MTTEPQRLQYLEAMGLTAWVARYRLPHARPTEACEWPLERKAPAAAPAERLHALLDEAETTPREPSAAPAEPAREPAPKRARQLLGLAPEEDAAAEPRPVHGIQRPAQARPAQEPLRFTLQVAGLAGRWLVVLPQQTAPDAIQSQLLANLLSAAGIKPQQPLVFEAFRWPPMENLPVEEPLEEARDGLQAFVEGTRRRGWALERVVMFGQDSTLARLFEAQQNTSRLLGLPGWQGPALAELAHSADAKRALWPTLQEWRRAWAQPADSDA